jgi:hypothetical protein
VCSYALSGEHELTYAPGSRTQRVSERFGDAAQPCRGGHLEDREAIRAVRGEEVLRFHSIPERVIDTGASELAFERGGGGLDRSFAPIGDRTLAKFELLPKSFEPAGRGLAGLRGAERSLELIEGGENAK